MKLSIVIPAYNESKNIPVIISKLKDSIETVDHIDDYEILICDDHSSDGTYEVAQGMNDNRIKCIRLSKRSGSHVALRAGLRHIKGDMALCVSADGQDDPGVLKQMVDKVVNGKDIVWGVRNKRNETFINKYFAVLFYKLLSIFVSNKNNVDLANADFYLLNRKVINTINQFEERNTSLFGLIAWIGFEQDQVLYERKERYSGKSKWGFGSKLKLATDWIIAFSGLPLKVIIILGFMIAILGFGYAVYILIFALTGNAIPGWASTTTLILLIGGIQLIMIGVLGEYLWRTLEESRKRPVYFIEKTNNINQ